MPVNPPARQERERADDPGWDALATVAGTRGAALGSSAGPGSEPALRRLAEAGLVERRAEGWRTTSRWQRAFMRAEARMLEDGDVADDPRLPITYALVDALGRRVPPAELGALVEALLPLELAEEAEMEPELEAEP